MMVAVKLPASRDLYIPAPFDGDTLKENIRTWLGQNTTDYWNWNLEFDQTTKDLNLVFRFSAQDDAILFKLTWY